MDKQREEFEECYPLAVWDAELQGYTEEQYTYALVGWRQAHAEMQPEIEFWEQLSKGQQDAYNSVVKQLSAANQRIAELLDLVEVVERRNKQLEDRIRVADAEKPSYKTNIVPDSQCKQSKCANATTGCVGYCKLDELSKGLSVTMSATLTEA